MKQRTIHGIITIGGLVGMTAAFMQTLEKLTLLKNAHATLTCNFNSVFSCSNVLNAWQSSVLGFPNSIMCLVLFTIFTVAGAAGLANSKLSRGMRLGVQSLSLFTLAFALWFLGESIYVIHSLCVFCIFCFAGLLMVNWGWLRINASDLPIGERNRKVLARAIQTGADTFGWFLLGAIVALAMILKFS
jgi:uncharacterized membrane protein